MTRQTTLAAIAAALLVCAASARADDTGGAQYGKPVSRPTRGNTGGALYGDTVSPRPKKKPKAKPVKQRSTPIVTTAQTGVGGVFPIQGQWSFGTDEDRFGAKRNGHTHEGQDVLAADGTPLVAPVDATVLWRSYQSKGAGHYVVLHAADGTDYVFMHLIATATVRRGDSVRQGAPIGAVGHSGDAQGPHLHFEVWPDGWYSKGSAPVDPLPYLQRWAGPAT